MTRIPSAFVRELAKCIRFARSEMHMTQQELAQRIGVRKCTVCQYERGNRVPNVFMLAKIADVLCVTIGELVPDTECEEPDYSALIGQTRINGV